MSRSLAIGGVALAPGAPRIVAAGADGELDALAAADAADLVELRVDLFADPDPGSLPEVVRRLRAAGRPVIVTARAASEGGGALDDDRRLALYGAALPEADAIDVEIASTALVTALVPAARRAGRAVILSAHVADGTPPVAALIGLVDRGRELGADVTKVVTHARDHADLRTLLAVTLATTDVVTLAMGPLGPLSRIVLPAAGSLLTYAHVGRPTAPSGQLSLAELAPLVRRLLVA